MTRHVKSPLATWILAMAAALTLALVQPVTAISAEPPRLMLQKGDRIILIGNTLAERMQYYGHFETLLHAPFSRARADFS